MRWRSHPVHSVTIAGAVTILAAAALAPLAGSAIDASLKGTSPFASLPIREAVNLGAAMPAVALLLLLTSGDRRFTSARALAWVSGVSVLLLVVVRLLLQLATNVINLSEDPQWLGPELLIAVSLWPILWAVMWLVAQRERLVDAQTILLDEARRALHDDHEALRSRVFDHLHGTVTSELVVARVRLCDLAQETSDPRAASQLTAIAAHIQRIHELEVRRLAHAMVASGLETSLQEALRELADSCEGLCDIRVGIDDAYTELENRLTADARASLRLTIYRIVEECLSNALRHAHATHVDVDVVTSASTGRTPITITVSSDGEVPQTPPTSGVGMRVITARVGAYDGIAESTVNGGRFIVRAELQVDA